METEQDPQDAIPPADADPARDPIEALRHELALAMRACSARERVLLKALPEHRHQIWRAARLSGIAKTAVQKMLRRPRFQRAMAAIEALGLAELCITERMVLSEYVTLGKANLQDFHDEEGRPLPPHKWPAEWASAVQEYYVDKDGVTRIKLHDKGRPLDALAKYKRLAPDRVEVTGKDGGPIEVDNARERNLALIKSVASRTTGGPAAGPTSAGAQPTDGGGDA